MTKCVAEAWSSLHSHQSDIIIGTCRRLGISLPIEGSQDQQLSVKGIPSENLIIGDWQQELPVSYSRRGRRTVQEEEACEYIEPQQ